MRRLTRTQAIDELRTVLLRMVDGQNSLCRVAGWRNLFCHGFSQWNRAELERRFPHVPRAEWLQRKHLEWKANQSQLARQDIAARRLPCDVGACDSSAPCRGWGEFDERELARFHRELCGEAVEVVPDAAPYPGSG
jgi:hypothetical protein